MITCHSRSLAMEGLERMCVSSCVEAFARAPPPEVLEAYILPALSSGDPGDPGGEAYIPTDLPWQSSIISPWGGLPPNLNPEGYPFDRIPFDVLAPTAVPLGWLDEPFRSTSPSCTLSSQSSPTFLEDLISQTHTPPPSSPLVEVKPTKRTCTKRCRTSGRFAPLSTATEDRRTRRARLQRQRYQATEARVRELNSLLPPPVDASRSHSFLETIKRARLFILELEQQLRNAESSPQPLGISPEETYALADNRAAVVEQLTPDTAEYFYYKGLHLLQTQDPDAPDIRALLTAFEAKCGTIHRLECLQARRELLAHSTREDSKRSDTMSFLKNKLSLQFDHRKETTRTSSKPTHPTRLNPAILNPETLWKHHMHRFSDWDTAACDFVLSHTPTTPEGRTTQLKFIGVLERPDFPRLVDLIHEQLNDQIPFGRSPVHKHLTLEQMQELVAKHMEILLQSEFVLAYLSKLRPPASVNIESNIEERDAYYERLWAFVSMLAPSFNSLKVAVLYRRLELDRARGIYDESKFNEYMAIPRSAVYVDTKRMHEQILDKHTIAQYGASFRSIPPVHSDEELVRDYLQHFFLQKQTWEGFKGIFHERYLERLYAETQLLNGTENAEMAVSMLDDGTRLQKLRQEVRITLAPQNASFFAPEDPVALDVYVKNVSTLIVKVFEINTFNYLKDNLHELSTNVNLDGLIAHEETVHTYSESPMLCVRRRFEFPSLERRGVYVIEFIGNGRSSRAIIRKGQLRFVERVGAAGHVFSVLDEQNSQIPNAKIHVEGHAYTADEFGEIVVPFTTHPRRQPILLRHGEDNFTTLDYFMHKSEDYTLACTFYVDRETLLRGQTANVVVRPKLFVANTPVPLSLLKDVTLTLETTDYENVPTKKEVHDFALYENKESTYTFRVPEGLRTVAFTLSATIRSVTRGQTEPLQYTKSFSVNSIDDTNSIDDAFLTFSSSGFGLRLLGKSGEPKADVVVTVELKHAYLKSAIHTTLQTDKDGSIHLGPLPLITSLTLRRSGTLLRTWPLPVDSHTYPKSLHGACGETLFLPFMEGSAKESPPPLTPMDVCLMECRDDVFVRDCFASLSLRDGLLSISNLSVGDYTLFLKRSNQRITIRIAEGRVESAYVLSPQRLLELRNRRPLQISSVSEINGKVRVALTHATKGTRVHAMCTHFVPFFSLGGMLEGLSMPEPQMVSMMLPESNFLSGRDLGDEYRYILDRKYSKVYPGNMLRRPMLLLNPWAIQKTEMGLHKPEGGSEYAKMPPKTTAFRSTGGAMPRRPGGPSSTQYGSNMDFLAFPGVTLYNLVPDAHGILELERDALGCGCCLTLVAINQENVCTRRVGLASPGVPPTKDMRLQSELAIDRHYMEQHEVDLLVKAGDGFQIDDITTGSVEVYDTLSKVFTLLSALSHNETLTEFSFLCRWPTLEEREKLDLYSKFACHELSFFLYRKDPEFFQHVVHPHLSNKMEKTFLDRWLLNEDLQAYLRPYKFGMLNAVERILLAVRHPEERASIGKLIADEAERRVYTSHELQSMFRAALSGSSLDVVVDSWEMGEDYGASLDLGLMAKGKKKVWVTSPSPTTESPTEAEPQPRENAKDQIFAREESIMQTTVDDITCAMSGDSSILEPPSYRDLGRREKQRQFFRGPGKTQEFAENNYFKLPMEQQTADLVLPSQFWAHYASHIQKDDPSIPFVSRWFPFATRNFTEMMFVLSVLDLPFDSQFTSHNVSYEGTRMNLTASSPGIIFHRQLKESASVSSSAGVLVGQQFYDPEDRYTEERGERIEKYVKDEFLTAKVYGCQVVVTNTSCARQALNVLLQIPNGSIPVTTAFVTKTKGVELGPYSTTTLEYCFYFPLAGEFDQYPVHVGREEKLVAFAPSPLLEVVEKPTRIDALSWNHVSQEGTNDEVLGFLGTQNLSRISLDRIAWRMKDKTFCNQVLTTLSTRHVFNPTLWSYAVWHGVDDPFIEDFLCHNKELVSLVGEHLHSTLLHVDPFERCLYEHLAYAPIVNARAHQLGKTRQILNDKLRDQYTLLLRILCLKPHLEEKDLLEVTYYLILQDRIEEALNVFGRAKELRKRRVETTHDSFVDMQFDYLTAYLDLFESADAALALSIAEKYENYPVPRWNELFADIRSHITESRGRRMDPSTGEESREQVQGKLAGTEPSFEFSTEGNVVTVLYQNLSRCTANFYAMDVELLFSTNPFVQQAGQGHFSYIRPTVSMEIDLPSGSDKHSFPLPDACKASNVMVELEGAGIRKSCAHYAHCLHVQIIENYGQVKVTHLETGMPLSKVYVKVYARMTSGRVSFYKDGYTDIRGRFDYASLNTDEMDNTGKFALLVMSEYGSVIRECSPPKR